jgi:hypothetical protein
MQQGKQCSRGGNAAWTEAALLCLLHSVGGRWQLVVARVYSDQCVEQRGENLAEWSAVFCAIVCRCGIDEATAARIAREIERGDTSNPHLAEERGQAVDDSGVSGVLLTAAACRHVGICCSGSWQGKLHELGTCSRFWLLWHGTTREGLFACMQVFCIAVARTKLQARQTHPPGSCLGWLSSRCPAQTVLCCAVLCSWMRRTSTRG